LQSKWITAIQPSCSKFAGCWASIQALNKSGGNHDDKIQQAMILYASSPKNGKFKYLDCWEILCGHPKWQDVNERSGQMTPRKKKLKLNEEGDVIEESTPVKVEGARNPKSSSKRLQLKRGIKNPLPSQCKKKRQL
jgi:hypothetical protein